MAHILQHSIWTLFCVGKKKKKYAKLRFDSIGVGFNNRQYPRQLNTPTHNQIAVRRRNRIAIDVRTHAHHRTRKRKCLWKIIHRHQSITQYNLQKRKAQSKKRQENYSFGLQCTNVGANSRELNLYTFRWSTMNMHTISTCTTSMTTAGAVRAATGNVHYPLTITAPSPCQLPMQPIASTSATIVRQFWQPNRVRWPHRPVLLLLLLVLFTLRQAIAQQHTRSNRSAMHRHHNCHRTPIHIRWCTVSKYHNNSIAWIRHSRSVFISREVEGRGKTVPRGGHNNNSRNGGLECTFECIRDGVWSTVWPTGSTKETSSVLLDILLLHLM